MPRVFADPFTDGRPPTVKNVAYADLPLGTVIELALSGDREAVAWLNQQGGHLVAAGDWDEAKHPRDDHGRFGEGSSGTTVEPRVNDDQNFQAIDSAFDTITAYADEHGLTYDEYLERVGQRVTDELASHEIVVREPASAIGKILEDGQLRNQFETNSSSAWIDEEHSVRVSQEAAMFGIDAEADGADRPIYGTLEPWQDDGPSIGGGAEASMYGDFMFATKDEVADRSTWTDHDSLGTQEGLPDQTIGVVGSPDYTGLTFGPDMPDYLDQMGPGSVSLEAAARTNYLEAQIHGGIQLADVDAVYVDRFDADVRSILDKAAKGNVNAQVFERAMNALGGAELPTFVKSEGGWVRWQR